MKTHIIGIKELHQVRDANQAVRGKDFDELPSIEEAYLTIEDDKIVDFGKMDDFPTGEMQHAIDAAGGHVFPSYVDSHTHLVFAKTREQEFLYRLQGLSYQEIAERGGGILNSAAALAQMSEDALAEAAWQRLLEAMHSGTGAIEIKSGYGLSLEAELKMLRVIKRLQEAAPIPVKATFLGAHAFPKEYKEKPDAYVDLIIKEMLPNIAKENLASYIDVFCEKGYFNLEQTLKIIEAGAKYGLKPKVHVNQFNILGAIPEIIKAGAVSVDHLEVVDEKDVEALAHSNCIATLLPACSFFLGIPYAPAKELAAAGAAVALASDFNPGSSPTSNMEFVLSLACIKQKLLPAQAFNAVTINAAAAMELEDQLGTIQKGKLANFIITKPRNSIAQIPYAFAESSISKVFVNGKQQ